MRFRDRVRIVDVAALAGVAPGTASKALNGTGQLRDDTRERVQRAASQLGFTPDGLARGLSSGRSYTVGLVTTDSFGRFSMPILLGAEDALGAFEMSVLLCDTRDDVVRERYHLRNLVERRVDGILLTGRRTEPRAALDPNPPVPVVHVYTPSSDATQASVVVDDAAGARLAVEHVLELGRGTVAHITGPQSHRSAKFRARAAVAAIEAGGARLAGPVRYGEWSEAWGRHAIAAALRQEPTMDAVTCGSDQIARGVCDGLREGGRSVPQDVAVVGYDNWDVMVAGSRPPLSTIDPRLEELGRCAAQFLLDAIAGAPHSGVTSLMPRLLVRGSSSAH